MFVLELGYVYTSDYFFVTYFYRFRDFVFSCFDGFIVILLPFRFVFIALQRKSAGGKDGKEKKAKKVKRDVKPRPVSGYIMFCKGARPKLAKEEGRELCEFQGSVLAD